MKILHIIYSLSPGGAERFVVDLCNELVERQHDVTLCVIRDINDSLLGFYRNEISTKVNLINYKIKPGINFKISFLLIDSIKKTKADIVHCHLGTIYYLMPIAFFYRMTKYFYTVHNDASKEYQKFRFFKNLIRYYFKKKLIHPITISTDTSTSFVKYYNLHNFTQIENGRSKNEKTKDFDNVKNEIISISEGFKTVFLHVARFDMQKNQDLLIDCFNELIIDNLPIVLIIIGYGFDSRNGIILQKRAKKGIYFLGTKKNVSDYYLNADAFCLTSIYEGMPITLIEALSYGCFPICTPVGGINNVIIDNVNGYLSENMSKDKYIKVLQKYLSNKCNISKEPLIKYFYDNFSIEKCTQKYIDAYKS